jgi:lysozyme
MANQKTIWIAAGAVLLLLFAPGLLRAATTPSMSDILAAAAKLIAQFEGFSATPYWDVSRWSWGYGTAAPGSTGAISEADALAALQAHASADYATLQPQITRNLSLDQWAALLSFAYEEGSGNPGAGALVNDINAGNDSVLEQHWKEYVYAGGVVNSDIVTRRNSEWALWIS